MTLVAKNRGVRAKGGESIGKLLTASLRTADEGALGRIIVEVIILLSARTQPDSGKVLRAVAQAYKVDIDAIALKVKHEFAAEKKSRAAVKKGATQ